jgi:hypothetical protein
VSAGMLYFWLFIYLYFYVCNCGLVYVWVVICALFVRVGLFGQSSFHDESVNSTGSTGEPSCYFPFNDRRALGLLHVMFCIVYMYIWVFVSVCLCVCVFVCVCACVCAILFSFFFRFICLIIV